MPFQNICKQLTDIWAYASLLYVHYKNRPSLISNLLSALTDYGVFYALFKYKDKERIDERRFFCTLNEIRFNKVIASLNKSIPFIVLDH